MEDERSDSPVQPPAAPPTRPQEVHVAKKSTTWPTVFGVIGIAWGAFIVLSVGCTVAMMPFQIGMAEAAQSETERLLYEQTAQQAPMTMTLSIVSGLAAIVLIVAGAMLLSRRVLGVKLYAFWSWFDIVTTIGGSIWGAILLARLFDSLGTNGTSDPAVFAALIGAAFSMVFGLLTLILPITFLIWIRRERIREEIRGWR